MVPQLFVNTRCLRNRVTGVQRYTIELLKRLEIPFTPITPEKPMGRARSIIWEQTTLYSQAQKGILWSPANSGPIRHPNHVLTVHDLAVFKEEPWFNWAYRNTHRLLLNQTIPQARTIITVSEFIKNEILSRFDVDTHRIHVIPNGVDEAFFCEHKADPNSRYILTVGSLDPRKNLPKVIEAWKEVHRKDPDLELHVVGEATPIFKQIDMRFHQGSNIHFLGRLTDEELKEKYRGALAFLYPSLYEGFGLPVLEAMAAGTPVITSKGTAMEEITAGIGVIIDANSLPEIYDAIIYYSDKKGSDSLSRESQTRARLFSWDKAANQMTSLLQALSQ